MPKFMPTIDEIVERMRDDTDLHDIFDEWVRHTIIHGERVGMDTDLLDRLKYKLDVHTLTEVECEDEGPGAA